MAEGPFIGYNSVANLTRAAISAPEFLGSVHRTLLRHHNLDDTKILNFFKEFMKAIMYYKLPIAKSRKIFPRNKRTLHRLYASDPKIQVEIDKMSNFSNYFFTHTLATLPQEEKDKRIQSGKYHEELVDFLKNRKDTIINLGHILNNIAVSSTEEEFLFPSSVQDHLLNQLTGVTDLGNLKVVISTDEYRPAKVGYNKNPVLLRLFVAICSHAIQGNDFLSKYTDYNKIPLKSGLPHTDAIFTKITTEWRGLTEEQKGMTVAGGYTLFNIPRGEIGHLDIMTLYGQQHSYLPSPQIEGRKSEYWLNMHYSPKSHAVWHGEGQIRPKPAGYRPYTDPFYYPGQDIYPSTPASQNNEKIKYLQTHIDDRQTIITNSLKRGSVNIDKSIRFIWMFTARNKYFKSASPIVMDKPTYSILLNLYDQYIQLIKAIAEETKEAPIPIQAKRNSEILSRLQRLQAEIGNPIATRTSVDGLPDPSIPFFINFKEEFNASLKQLNANLYKNNSFTRKLKFNTSSIPSDTTNYACKELKGGINIENKDLQNILFKCERILHQNLLAVLNTNFETYFTTIYLKKEDPTTAENLNEMMTVCNYASVKTISATLKQYISDITVNPPDDVTPILTIILYILQHLDIILYQINNKGEKYTDPFINSDKIWDFTRDKNVSIPPLQRKAAFFLTFLDNLFKIQVNLQDMKTQELARLDGQKRHASSIKGRTLNSLIEFQQTRYTEAAAAAAAASRKQKASLEAQAQATQSELQTLITQKREINTDYTTKVANVNTLFDKRLKSLQSIQDKIILNNQLAFSDIFPINNSLISSKLKADDFANINAFFTKLIQFLSSQRETFLFDFNKKIITFPISMVGSFNKWISENKEKNINEVKLIIEDTLRVLNSELNKSLYYICKKTDGSYYINNHKDLTTNIPKEFSRCTTEKKSFSNNSQTTVTLSNAEETNFNVFSQEDFEELENINTNSEGGRRLRKTRKSKRTQKRTRKTRKD